MASLVALIGCASYDNVEVEAAVRRGMGLLGGPARFVKAGERILLKPNALYGADPARCISTHPAVLRGVGVVLKDAGALLCYGDSSAVMAGEGAMKRSGYGPVAAELGLEHVSLERGRPVSHPGALIAHRLVLAEGALAADGIVSVSKCKTHNLVRFTGAIKNQYGCVPGMTKGQYHAQYPDVYDFSRMLVDINTFLKPRLYVMDAVEAMEGNGPGSGVPRHLGVLLISADPVALDATACRIIHLPHSCVPTLALGEEAGLGTAETDGIELVGDALEQFVCPDFDVRREAPVGLSGGGLRRAIKSIATPRPVIVRQRCIRCGRCVNICPVTPRAVDWGPGGRSVPPRHRYASCIRCFCCNEVCPEKAIEVRTPLVGRLLPPLAYLSLLASRVAGRALRRS
jgi:uncharacterized protein (DUF362 family)/Pyruvate/2-oxoacid:ferredoxin oxidoreductase delta subunit